MFAPIASTSKAVQKGKGKHGKGKEKPQEPSLLSNSRQLPKQDGELVLVSYSFGLAADLPLQSM